MGRKSREQVIAGQISELEKELAEVKRNHRWQCPECSRKTRVRDIDLIESQWYESPYGCTGGDRWRHGGFKFLCPKCGHEYGCRNISEWDDKDSKNSVLYRWFAKYRRYFRSEEIERSK